MYALPKHLNGALNGYDLQWLDGKLECVLPLDAANKGLVLPIPHPPILLAGAGVTRTPSPFTPGVIVAIVAGCVCLLAVSAALFALHRYQVSSE